jgi:hypothetical protein
MLEIVDGTCRRREVEDKVYGAHVERLDDILLDEFEARFPAKMSEVGRVSSDEVVDADHTVAIGEESIAEMRA